MEKTLRQISRSIDIKRLERETNRWLFLGFAVAVLFHALLGIVIEWRLMQRDLTAQEAINEQRKPIPIRMIVRSRPHGPFGGFRLNAPAQKHRDMKPEQSQNEARPTVQAMPKKHSFLLDELHIGAAPRYHADSSAPSLLDSLDYIPDDIGLADDGIRRREKNHIYMTDDMIALEHLDTGEHKALLIADPNDRLNIRGFFHHPGSITGANLHSMSPLHPYREFVISRYTGIDIVIDAPIAVSDRKLFDYPFLMFSIAGEDDLTDDEANTLFEYCEQGGLIFMEATGVADMDGIQRSAPAVRNMIADIFKGKARLRHLSGEHHLYHCFFDYSVDSGWNHYKIENYDAWKKQPLYCLEGVFYKGRLALIYSEKGFEYGWVPEQYMTASHFGVNLLVYALTRQNSTAPVLVDVSTVTQHVSRRDWDYYARVKHRHSEKSVFNPLYTAPSR